MKVQPYLLFGGRAEEAATFYREVLGAEVALLMRFSDAPDPAPPGMIPEGWGDKVMHMELRIGDTAVMGTDGGCQEQQQGAGYKGFSLTASVPDAAAAERVFAALGAGGSVQMPLMQTFFSPAFGTLTDRFGISWMVVTEAPAAA